MHLINNIKIYAVIVTYNQLELLKKCIESVNNQTRKLDQIIVVNNSSNDGTKEWLVHQSYLTVINQENLGGAGGFNTGIKYALEEKSSWVWLLDSDVIPANDALQQLVNSSNFGKNKTGFLSSVVTVPHGGLSYINVPYLSYENEVINALVSNQDVPIISSSFGSVLVNMEVVKKIGLPAKNFFIWGDDVEFSMRMIANGYYGYLILKSFAVHHQFDNSLNPFESLDLLSWKAKYAIRNTVFVVRLRNIVLHHSVLRGWIAELHFIYFLIKSRRHLKFDELLKVIKYWIEGLLFKPDINE